MTWARSALALLATALLTTPVSATEPGVEPAAGELLIASQRTPLATLEL